MWPFRRSALAKWKTFPDRAGRSFLSGIKWVRFNAYAAGEFSLKKAASNFKDARKKLSLHTLRMSQAFPRSAHGPIWDALPIAAAMAKPVLPQFVPKAPMSGPVTYPIQMDLWTLVFELKRPRA